MPSPVSAKMAEEIKQDNDSEFDDATVISSDFKGFKLPESNTTNKSPVAGAASPTPVPEGDYDPKKLSAKDGATPPNRKSDATREVPAVIISANVVASAPPRTTPAIIRTGHRAGSSATVETPKIIADELSAKLALPTPAPPSFGAAAAAPAQAKKQKMIGILAAVVLLVGGGVGALFLFGGDDGAEEEEVETPTTVTTEPQDDSVGNLIKLADDQFVAGELIGEGGALSLLVAARIASPDDERVALRLAPLADKFKELGDASLAAGDIVAAVAHYKNSLEADPKRREVEQKIFALESEIKNAEEDSK